MTDAHQERRAEAAFTDTILPTIGIYAALARFAPQGDRYERTAVMSATDGLLANNRRYAEAFAGPAPGRPSLGVAVVACMDARMDVYALLGLGPGEAHVLRNAGGEVTDDMLRSLTISQHELGTTEIVLIHHAQCGMQTFTNREFKAELEAETGHKPHWASLAFTDVDQDLRKSIARVKAYPFLNHTLEVRGFVFDVETGSLREVQ